MPAITPTSLDHVALWVADRDALAALLCDHLGMHVIDRTDSFTLVGADARLGKLTLFAADGPRDPGALAAIVLRVRSLEEALERLPDDHGIERDGDSAWIDAPEGLRIGLVEQPDAAADPDLDHVQLVVSDVEATASALAELGFERRGGVNLHIADKWITLEGGGTPEGERPLLNHVAVLVDSVADVEAEARARGADIADVVDAPNTLAVFVWAPDRLKLEYVEHKPSFSLA